MRQIQVRTASGTDGSPACMSRREFLLASGSSVAVVTLGAFPAIGLAQGQAVQALRAEYPRQKIGSLSRLARGQPVEFAYPYPSVRNILVKLGVPAGAGIGPEQDVVAFNQQCTHMGGPLQGTYNDAYQMLGPCPMHLTTFDLTRHGMVVAGHATESLPQILLELERDVIVAVGVQGLLFGYSSNLAGRRNA